MDISELRKKIEDSIIALENFMEVRKNDYTPERLARDNEKLSCYRNFVKYINFYERAEQLDLEIKSKFGGNK